MYWGVYVCTGFALFGSFQFGYHIGLLNTCLYYVSDSLHFTMSPGGDIVVSALVIGAAIGSLFAGQIADATGPKRALVFNNIFTLTGCTISAFAVGFYSMTAGRFITGWGAGAASLYVPRYIAEVSPPAVRGALGTMHQAFITLGILVSYVIGIPYEEGIHTLHVLGTSFAWWQVMFAFGCVPAIIQVLGLSTRTESPVWLSWKGYTEEAHAARSQLVGSNDAYQSLADSAPGTSSEQDAETALQQILEPEHEAGWGELFSKRYRLMTALALGLPILQQLSGINSVIFFSSEVLKTAGLGSPIIGSVLVGAVNVGTTLIAAALMDRLGRKPLLVASHAAMAVCLIAMSLAAFLLPPTSSLSGYTSLASMLLYVFSFAIGSGPIPWLYLSEILSERIKGRAAALGTSLNWTAALLISSSFQSMLRVLGIGGSYLIFAAFNMLAVVYMMVLMVETKQRSLHHIKSLLLSNE